MIALLRWQRSNRRSVAASLTGWPSRTWVIFLGFLLYLVANGRKRLQKRLTTDISLLRKFGFMLARSSHIWEQDKGLNSQRALKGPKGRYKFFKWTLRLDFRKGRRATIRCVPFGNEFIVTFCYNGATSEFEKVQAPSDRCHIKNYFASATSASNRRGSSQFQ